jgi:hypothetical protein
MRTESAKLVYYPTWKGGPFWEYFDLTKDSHEMTNLCNDPQHRAMIADMKLHLRGLAEQYRDARIVEALDRFATSTKDGH